MDRPMIAIAPFLATTNTGHRGVMVEVVGIADDLGGPKWVAIETDENGLAYPIVVDAVVRLASRRIP